MPWSDYQKIREIGHGRFGTVFLVQTLSPPVHLRVRSGPRQLVMKEVELGKMGTNERQRAEVELKALSALKHPYIARYWERFTQDRYLCIVREYGEGGDLWKYIERCRRRDVDIPESYVVRWLSQLCLALKYMQDKRAVHGDVKTQNVLLWHQESVPPSNEGGPEGCVKLADFGLDRALAGLRDHGETPFYMSPEICSKQPYAASSDIWGLGCVICELCARPFEKTGEDEHAIQVLPRILRNYAPLIPPSYSRALYELVTELLCRETVRRPAASALVQRPLVQAEIKRMLFEHSSEIANKVEDTQSVVDGSVSGSPISRENRRPRDSGNCRGGGDNCGSGLVFCVNASAPVFLPRPSTAPHSNIPSQQHQPVDAAGFADSRTCAIGAIGGVSEKTAGAVMHGEKALRRPSSAQHSGVFQKPPSRLGRPASVEGGVGGGAAAGAAAVAGQAPEFDVRRCFPRAASVDRKEVDEPLFFAKALAKRSPHRRCVRLPHTDGRAVVKRPASADRGNVPPSAERENVPPSADTENVSGREVLPKRPMSANRERLLSPSVAVLRRPSSADRATQTVPVCQAVSVGSGIGDGGSSGVEMSAPAMDGSCDVTFGIVGGAGGGDRAPTTVCQGADVCCQESKRLASPGVRRCSNGAVGGVLRERPASARGSARGRCIGNDGGAGESGDKPNSVVTQIKERFGIGHGCGSGGNFTGYRKASPTSTPHLVMPPPLRRPLSEHNVGRLLSPSSARPRSTSNRQQDSGGCDGKAGGPGGKAGGLCSPSPRVRVVRGVDEKGSFNNHRGIRSRPSRF
eukprot:TRINITY_DN23928_c0_g2_i1.p1 TRINITY_DN23928_c0_g2~~TRINITY_DN23928_c0_g2_i1.p1  ORF type:complete len:802 (-),score=120.27 TRINITY_DN23928_c0_g2_i1:204-2609(-)